MAGADPDVSLPVDFTGPQHGAYEHADPVPFGEGLVLPEPFALTLDTGAFPH
ncbi:hypothetical protein [Streptomyces sp. PvR034]|uniref:hypothetical protein n=1 Tax=Streptomyces sp. PvR034 TaxID=3156401 RepID=UPI003398E284